MRKNRRWPGVKPAARELGVSYEHLLMCVKGIRRMPVIDGQIPGAERRTGQGGQWVMIESVELRSRSAAPAACQFGNACRNQTTREDGEPQERKKDNA